MKYRHNLTDGRIVYHNVAKIYTIKTANVPISQIQEKVGNAFLFYKNNIADYSRFVSGMYWNGLIVNKQGSWIANISGDYLIGNDNNDVWTFYSLYV